MNNGKIKTKTNILEVEKSEKTPIQFLKKTQIFQEKFNYDFIKNISFSPINRNNDFDGSTSKISPIFNIICPQKTTNSSKRNETSFMKKLNNMTTTTYSRSDKYKTPKESSKVKLISQTFHEKTKYLNTDTQPSNKKLELFSFYNSKEYGCKPIFMPKSIKKIKMRPKISVFEKYYFSTKQETENITIKQEKYNFLNDFEEKQMEIKENSIEINDKIKIENLNDILLRNKVRNFMKNNYDQLSLFGDNQSSNHKFYTKIENCVNYKYDINLAPTIQNKLEIFKNFKPYQPEIETGYVKFQKEKKKLKEVNNLSGVPRKLGEELSQIRVNYQISKDRLEYNKKRYGLNEDIPHQNTQKYIDFLEEINHDINYRKNDSEYFDYFSTKYVKYNEVNFADKRAKEIVMKRKAILNSQGIFKKMIIDNVKVLNSKFLQIREELKISEEINNITRLSKLGN
jgi:hypothetical protein